MNTEQLNRMRSGKGFIAALDQSGGSTPKALDSMVLLRTATMGRKRCLTWSTLCVQGS